MLSRRRFVDGATAMLLVPSLSRAQSPSVPQGQARPQSRIAFLCTGSCSRLPNTRLPGDEAFVTTLESGGYAIGKNVTVDMLGVGVDDSRLEATARRLVERQASVIMAQGNRAVEASRRATRVIPIVMMGASDPVEEGLVASLAKPGGNVTGLAVPGTTLLSKQMELLKELQPRVRRVAVLLDPMTRQRERLARAAQTIQALGVVVEPVAAATQVVLGQALESVKAGRFDAVVILEHLIATNAVRDVALFALENKILAIGTGLRVVQAGGVMSFGPADQDLYARTATYVTRLLGGAKPADLPVEEFTRYEIGLNLAAAKALGLTVPASLRLRADTVFE